MTGFRGHVFKDGDGARVRIGESADHPHAAFVDPDTDRGFCVPAHRLAELTRALYAAAGQPAPDLPVIHDPELVRDLAKDLLYALEGTSHGRPGAARYEGNARTLLSLGWRKP